MLQREAPVDAAVEAEAEAEAAEDPAGPSVLTLAAASVTLVFLPLLALEMHAWSKGWGVVRALTKKKKVARNANVGEDSTHDNTSDTFSERKTNKSLDDVETASTKTAAGSLGLSTASPAGSQGAPISPDELQLQLDLPGLDDVAPEQRQEQAAILADLDAHQEERDRYRKLTMRSQPDEVEEPLSPGFGFMTPTSEAFLEPTSPLAPERADLAAPGAADESRRSSNECINVDDMLAEGFLDLDELITQQQGEVSQASGDSGLVVVDGTDSSMDSHCSV